MIYLAFAQPFFRHFQPEGDKAITQEIKPTRKRLRFFNLLAINQTKSNITAYSRNIPWIQQHEPRRYLLNSSPQK